MFAPHHPQRSRDWRLNLGLRSFPRSSNRDSHTEYPYRMYSAQLHSGENLPLQRHQAAAQLACSQPNCPHRHTHPARFCTHGVQNGGIDPRHIHIHQDVHTLARRPHPLNVLRGRDARALHDPRPVFMDSETIAPGGRLLHGDHQSLMPRRIRPRPLRRRFRNSRDDDLDFLWNGQGIEDSVHSDDESSHFEHRRRRRSSSLSSDQSSSTSEWSLRPRRRRRPVDTDDTASWSRERGNARWFTPRWWN